MIDYCYNIVVITVFLKDCYYMTICSYVSRYCLYDHCCYHYHNL